MKTIYAYNSYRTFLKDFYLHWKKTTPAYSYAKFANEANLNSPNYLKLVIDGKRNLTSSNIHQFARALKLNFDELVYFEALVLSEQASTTNEKAYYNQRIGHLRSGKPTNGIRLKYKEFISKWYSPAIIFALQGRSADVDMKKISKMIGISEHELEEGISMLRRKKILNVENGIFSCDSNHIIYHDPKLSNIFQKNYLKEQLDRSVLAFQKRYTKGAKFHSHTFTIPATDFQFYESQLNSFVEHLIAKADTGNPEKMAQLNFQFFTLEE